MTLQMEELEGSPTIRLNRKEMIGTRIFKVDWADWPTFVELVWGVWQNVGSATTYIPASSFYGLPGMWASDIDITPLQPDSPLGGSISLGGIQVGYNWAKITVTYKPFPIPDGRYPNVPNGTFLVIDGNIGSEYMTVPGRHWQWPDNTSAEDDLTPGLLVPHESIQMSWRWVPQPPWTAMRTIRGCVNNAAFFGHAAGNSPATRRDLRAASNIRPTPRRGLALANQLPLLLQGSGRHDEQRSLWAQLFLSRQRRGRQRELAKADQQRQPRLASVSGGRFLATFPVWELNA